MTEIKISVSDKLDGILQKLADNLGIKKAELVKNIVVKELMEKEDKKR
jgi:predicted DNA-binding protein